MAFEVAGVRDNFLCDAGAMAFAGRIAQSIVQSANNAAVQGSSPCMTILPLFLLLLYSC